MEYTISWFTHTCLFELRTVTDGLIEIMMILDSPRNTIILFPVISHLIYLSPQLETHELNSNRDTPSIDSLLFEVRSVRQRVTQKPLRNTL